MARLTAAGKSWDHAGRPRPSWIKIAASHITRTPKAPRKESNVKRSSIGRHANGSRRATEEVMRRAHCRAARAQFEAAIRPGSALRPVAGAEIGRAHV